MIERKHVEMIAAKTIKELKMEDFLNNAIEKIANIAADVVIKKAGLEHEEFENDLANLSEEILNNCKDSLEENISDLSESVITEVVEWYEEFCSDEE